MVNELSRAGFIASMKVLTVTPAIPAPVSSGSVTPKPSQVIRGVDPRSQHIGDAERWDVQNHRLKIVARVGSPDVRDAKEGK